MKLRQTEREELKMAGLNTVEMIAQHFHKYVHDRNHEREDARWEIVKSHILEMFTPMAEDSVNMTDLQKRQNLSRALAKHLITTDITLVKQTL